jgi:hypothetical protein
MKHYTYDEITVGQVESFTATVGAEQMELFRRLTGDENPLHTEHGVVYGLLTASYLSTLAGMYLPGERALIHGVSVEFPTRFDLDKARRISITGKVAEKADNFNLLTLKVTITDESGGKLLRGSMKVGVRA